eukprot:gnl/TRDRNA2_/TRDRNA2_153288_c0_seq1.p1 gnl/TRDRNA2_/TRDRNA2_153288_c0~~gnl/TRDRNA2_/TRDRNA2_153288_c0_seq1.p1  ORF type:complete len:539 (-),score=38.35 gnl/TRDRNA2_/TRDRNA2_153288_c0_seq1:85-1701(-)
MDRSRASLRDRRERKTLPEKCPEGGGEKPKFARFSTLTSEKAHGAVNHNCLKKIKFFDGRDPNFLDALMNDVEVEVFNEGDDIIKEGSSCDALFFLVYGAVEILVTAADELKRVAELGEGSVFGEMTFFGVAKASTATVRATELCNCRVIHHFRFNKVLVRFPEEKRFFKELAEQRKQCNSNEAGSSDRHSSGASDGSRPIVYKYSKSKSRRRSKEDVETEAPCQAQLNETKRLRGLQLLSVPRLSEGEASFSDRSTNDFQQARRSFSHEPRTGEGIHSEPLSGYSSWHANKAKRSSTKTSEEKARRHCMTQSSRNRQSSDGSQARVSQSSWNTQVSDTNRGVSQSSWNTRLCDTSLTGVRDDKQQRSRSSSLGSALSSEVSGPATPPPPLPSISRASADLLQNIEMPSKESARRSQEQSQSMRRTSGTNPWIPQEIPFQEQVQSVRRASGNKPWIAQELQAGSGLSPSCKTPRVLPLPQLSCDTKRLSSGNSVGTQPNSSAMQTSATKFHGTLLGRSQTRSWISGTSPRSPYAVKIW